MPTTDILDRPPWADYAARVAEIAPPLAPGDGYSDADLDAAESRLGHKLPRVLREFYRVAGRREDLHDAFDHLIPPAELHDEQGALILFEEHENNLLWGVRVADLAHDDPPVVLAENEVALTWDHDQDTLSSFLLTMLYWNAANGALPYASHAAIDETLIPEIAAHWPKVELLGSLWHHLIVFHKAGQVLCITGHHPDLTLHVAGRTPSDLDAITRRLQLDPTPPAQFAPTFPGE